MSAVVFWLLVAYLLKKMDDRRRSYISEDDYRRIQKEQDEKDGRKEKLLTDRKDIL